MRFLLRNFSSIFISLVLAILVWVAAVREQNPPREGDYGQPIPIEITPHTADLTNTASIPEAVRVRLLAPESSWADLSPSKFKASVDLSALGPGFSDVPIVVAVSDPNVEVIDQSPGVASVNLEPTQVISVPVEVMLADEPPLGYTNRPPVIAPETVSVSGPATLINQVASAIAQVYIQNSKETIQTTAPVVVRDENNRIIRDVTVTPPEIAVTVPIEQRFGYKDVSVRVSVQGQVAPGYRVSNIRIDPPTITVVGNPKGLGQIVGLVETMPINLDQATNSIVRTVPLNLPDGVTTVVSDEDDPGPDGVQVTIEITPIEDGITLQRPITQQGINPDFWWRASPDKADVFLSGPLTQLRSLRASEVEVLVDLFDLPPGTHVLKPTIFKPDDIRLDAILPDTVEVTIGKTVQRPVTPQELGADYDWSAAPNHVNVLLAGSAEQLQNLTAEEIAVTADLSGLEPGFYKIKPTVTVPAGVVVDALSPDTLNVTINPKTGPTITPNATLTGTGTISTPQAPSALPGN